MKQHGSGHAMAELAAAAALQAEITHHRLALEWGHMVLTRMTQRWDHIEACEALAYEDKVAAQVHVLDEATGSLWRLHKMLAYSRRVLHQHQRQLRHQVSSIELLPTPSGRIPESDAKTRSPSRGRRSRVTEGTKASSPSPRCNGDDH
jgi:hypothetical protein